MTDTKHETKQNASHTPEDEALADAVLKAAGSGLRHYTMAKTREAILSAAQEGLNAARSGLLESLDYLLEQTIDQDLKYGIGLTEGEEDARKKALAAIAKAKGVQT